MAQQFDVHPSQITEWKRQLQGRPADVFGAASEPPVDLKALHAKVGHRAPLDVGAAGIALLSRLP